MYRPVTEEIGPDEPPDLSSDPEMDDSITNTDQFSSTEDSSPQRLPYDRDIGTVDSTMVDFSAIGPRTGDKRAHVHGRVFVQCNVGYLVTLPGIMKVFQLVSTWSCCFHDVYYCKRTL